MSHSSLRLAGLLWLCAGVTYLAAEAVAASAFPGYSYARNYISDLGVPYPGEMSGRVLRSGLAPVMNWGGFILDGLLYGAATLMVARARPRGWAVTAFLALGLAHAVGTVLVGAVHSGNREMADGTHQYHILGAALAIVGGNAASLAAARLAREWGVSLAYAGTSCMLGVFGFIALCVLEMGGHCWPDGLVERASVYAITGWEILTGVTLLGGRLWPERLDIMKK